MNRKDRRNISKEIRKYYSIVIPAITELSRNIETMKDSEEEKLSHLPESLRGNSSQADNIQEAIEQFEEILDCLETVRENCESILDTSGTEKPEISSASSSMISDNSLRNKRFQILLSEDIFQILKIRSLQLGLSCNEIINQSLQNELFKDPNL